jgi:hypothetical protein
MTEKETLWKRMLQSMAKGIAEAEAALFGEDDPTIKIEVTFTPEEQQLFRHLIDPTTTRGATRKWT